MNQDALLALCHEQAHYAPHDPEDVGWVTFTARDVWMLLLATLVASSTFDCLDEEYAELVDRMREVLEVQKPHWQAEDEDA